MKMKKVLVSLVAVVMLFGCSSKGSADSKTCTVEQAGVKMTTAVKAKDDKIQSLNIKTSTPASTFGATVDFSKITDDQKKTLEDQLLKSMKVEAGQGIEVSSNFTKEAMELTINLDLEKAKDSASSVLGSMQLPADDDLTIDAFVKEMETLGAECK